MNTDIQQKLEATLTKLVLIPSITADSDACHEVIDFAKSEIETLGLFIHTETDTSHPWLIATTKDTKTPDILLAAHLDVVPATSDLFIMEKRDDTLRGRGVYDMKLAAACYIEFLKAHADKLPDLNIGILFTTDEETSGASMQDVLAWGLRPKVVFLPDGGDNWSVEKRAKGLYSVELIARGKSAHGSRPWEGVNALHTIMDAVHQLRSKYPSHNPSDATLSVNKLRSGEASNQIPDHASVMIDFRSFDEQELTDVKLFVAELVMTHDLDLKVIHSGDPLLFDADNPNVQSFMRALKETTGSEEVPYCESYGASDARYFARYDIPSIIIEPHGGGRHSNEEWLKASDLALYYQLIEHWILSDATQLAPVYDSELATA